MKRLFLVFNMGNRAKIVDSSSGKPHLLANDSEINILFEPRAFQAPDNLLNSLVSVAPRGRI